MTPRTTTTAAAALALSIAACDADDTGTADGVIAVDHVDAAASLRVAYGTRWVLGGDVAADATGAFRIPIGARAVVAYVDANRNERFERFVEPSGDCELVARKWRCTVALQRTTVHRAISQRVGERGDRTLIFWEDFHANGRRVDDSQLCVGERCTVNDVNPFVAGAQVHMLSLCGDEGFPDQQATLRGATARAAPITIAHPRALDAHVRSENRAGDLHVYVRASSLDRVLVWAATVAAGGNTPGPVYWHSEAADIAITHAPDGAAIRIPSAGVRVCEQDPACEIVIQLLDYSTPPGAAVVSATEYRSTVTFRDPS